MASEGDIITSGIMPMCSDKRLYSFLLRRKCFFVPFFRPQEMMVVSSDEEALSALYVPSMSMNSSPCRINMESTGLEAEWQNDRK